MFGTHKLSSTATPISSPVDIQPPTQGGVWRFFRCARSRTRHAPFFSMLEIAALFVLLVLAINAGNIFLTERWAHRREQVMRLTLGATRGRLILGCVTGDNAARRTRDRPRHSLLVVCGASDS